MQRADERGFAIVMAMFMTLMVSALAAAMTYVARTEVESTASYTTMAQARYAAESGVAAASNYLLSAGYAAVAPGTATDGLGNYNMTVSPVLRSSGGGTVTLSSLPTGSNYPASGVVTAFQAAAGGTLPLGGGAIRYDATARLIAMRQMADGITGSPFLLQTWEITGVGRRPGAGSADVEVTAVIERQSVPVFRYAAFATHTGCSALTFAGGATTGSFNSSAALSGGVPVTGSHSGHVGTNGNLTISGSTTRIHGTLSTPRAGLGSCTANNVTAVTVEGQAEVSGGLVELPQVVDYPTPPAPSPAPPTSSVTFTKNCPTGVTNCTVSGSVVTITPTPGVPYVLGNVSVEGQTELVLNPGTYIVNSISVSGANTQIRVAGGSGSVVFQVAGQNHTQPIYIAGNSLSNPSFDPSRLQFVYGGTASVYVAGGTASAALIYAPRANATLAGNSDFYGAVIGRQVNVPGSARLFYDRNLSTTAQTAGNPIMSTFTWRTF